MRFLGRCQCRLFLWRKCGNGNKCHGMPGVPNRKSSTKQVRPFIVSLVAKNGKLDEETIKQLIAMQEDLQNVIGRRRIKASIGIHNSDSIKFPVTYKTVKDDFSFIPLGDSESHSIQYILKDYARRSC